MIHNISLTPPTIHYSQMNVVIFEDTSLDIRLDAYLAIKSGIGLILSDFRRLVND